MSTIDALRNQLEKARRELLDLSTRNRLLNTPRHRKRSRYLEIVDELSDEVLRILVHQPKRMGFKPARASEMAEDQGGIVEGDMFSDLAPPEEEEADERGIAARHADIWLQTRMTPEGLQKRLLQLYYDARTAYEEQGVNILYLALGMLEWYEDSSSEQSRHAPLVLIPVHFDRGSALHQFRLSWSEQEIGSNLSLIQRFKNDFGINIPEVDEFDDLSFSKYCRDVEKEISSQRRFVVHPNDIVLGFFSFAKFLMYRDLDPASWPEDANITEHDLVNAMLGDGFRAEPAVIGDDEPIDPHIGPRDMVHVVDADSSQTVVIEEVKRGSSLVIQGPPGTGKSQTIANLIAAGVAEGKKVLFVAEKMAALDVVSRRLGNIDLGDMCLELHSRKANKRALLDDLDRTLQLGRPKIGNIDDLAPRLSALRDQLNEHATRLHMPLAPSDQTPYRIMGHLIRLGQNSGGPVEFVLPEPESWTRQEFRERRGVIHDLSQRIEEIGTPADHPWRGVGIEAVLPADVARVTDKIANLEPRIAALIADVEQLSGLLGTVASDNSAKGISLLVNTALRVADAPAELDGEAICSSSWGERRDAIRDIVAAGKVLADSHLKLEGIVVEAAWSTELATARRDIAAYGRSWFRLLYGRYRQAFATLRGILGGQPPKTLAERLRIIDTLITGQKAEIAVAADDALGASAFGKLWRQDKSDWKLLYAIEQWDHESHRHPVQQDFRVIVARVDDRDRVRKLASEVEARVEPLVDECGALFAALKLDTQQAFSVDSAEALPFDLLVDRLKEWSIRSENITQWITYRTRSKSAIEHGLAPVVERLYDGRLSPDNAVESFEIAYYEALMREVFKQQSALATFDGKEHKRFVNMFCKDDRERIELAREEVVLAHYQGLPRGGAEVGQLGLLNREFNKRRRHLPIRRLMKEAGLAIQAIKPVFMMSPLSIAQFLEPGALQFDLLLIDEASQVRPVDALGAVARAGQIVVVGDDKQLPPTRFFERTLGDEDYDEEVGGLWSAGDIESVLGLCTAQGIRQRMLRWHYRSRHPSLVAVSNHEFYDGRLFVIPSPYSDESDLGLHFHYLPEGVFDRGGTATNRVEAKAIARSVIDHARQCPDLSLGVGCFSIRQRDAILDELEHLWRSERDVQDFFALGGPEPFFVKNLENIQGDERDVIFISVGYAKNRSGYMAMTFGPVSTEGGERRLNVLITRARRRCEVFSSITADDIDLHRGRSRGVAALKTFLQYAQTRILGVAVATGAEFDSPFEEEVAKALSALGYEVDSQIGIAGFFVDLAVRDPDRSGRYLIGIECDGAAYHSARSARDRDRLRQQVLEDHGWIIHRIWSTDWFQRPEEQLRKTKAAIEAVKAKWAKRDAGLIHDRPADASRKKPRKVARTVTNTVDNAPAEEVPNWEPYLEAEFTIFWSKEPHLIRIEKMADIVTKVVKIEGPIHSAEIARRIANLCGLRRTGNRIVAAVNKGISRAVKRGGLMSEGSFYSPIGDKETVFRDRTDVNSSTLRKAEMLPPSEIRVALLIYARRKFRGHPRRGRNTGEQAFRLQGYEQAIV
ncbi:MAG: DUF3320 domain-containing protein [Proteobacteria bacterium]|nr:DUF3320 domain-containing protein [Pseudomonadota bacterium]